MLTCWFVICPFRTQTRWGLGFCLAYWCVFGRMPNKYWLTGSSNEWIWITRKNVNSICPKPFKSIQKKLMPSGHWLIDLYLIWKSAVQTVLGTFLLGCIFLLSELLSQYKIWHLVYWYNSFNFHKIPCLNIYTFLYSSCIFLYIEDLSLQ